MPSSQIHHFQKEGRKNEQKPPYPCSMQTLAIYFCAGMCYFFSSSDIWMWSAFYAPRYLTGNIDLLIWNPFSLISLLCSRWDYRTCTPPSSTSHTAWIIGMDQRQYLRCSKYFIAVMYCSLNHHKMCFILQVFLISHDNSDNV